MEKESEWSALPPTPPSDYQWTVATDRISQKRTRHYYLVAEVLSAFEKTVLRHDSSAHFWFQEIINTGPHFVTTGWATLFHLAMSTTTMPYTCPLFTWMCGEYSKYKLLSTDDDDDNNDDTAHWSLDPRCRDIMTNVVQALVQIPKCRTIDSAVRAFLMPYPTSSASVVRPYEPYLERVHLRPPPASHFIAAHGDANQWSAVAQTRARAHCDTWIPNTSYVGDPPDEEQEVAPRYTLYELHPSDPPYLARWCNALCQSFLALRDPDSSEEMARRAIFYHVGLIYQCCEPCHMRQRKQDSVQIIWDILLRFGANVEGVTRVRKMADEFAKASHKRERYYLATAIMFATTTTTTTMNAASDTWTPPVAPSPVTLDVDHRGLLPIPVEALDYTTREGQRRGHGPAEYVRDTAVAADDPYQHFAVALEEARSRERFKDPRRKLVSQVPLLRFPTGKGGGRTKSSPEDFDLSDVYCFDPTTATALPWRGQFLLGERVEDKRGALCARAHVYAATFTEVQAVPSTQSFGLFSAVYHPPGVAAGTRVFFIPCTRGGPRQAFNQCLVDELKPLFGVPALGTHCMYVDCRIVKRDRSQPQWAPDNFTVEEDSGMHLVMFRASSLGGGDASTESAAAAVFDPSPAALGAPEFQGVRHQLINVFAFHFCTGVTDSRTVLRPIDEGPPIQLLDGADEETRQAATQGLIIPFCEVSAFTNATFPVVVRASMRSKMAQLLLIDDQRYLMQRFFDLVQFLDFDSIEAVLQRFGAPAVEWTGVIRDNVRDLRTSWVVWSKSTEARLATQREQKRERDLLRGGTKKKKAKVTPPKTTVMVSGEDQESDVARPPKRKKLPPTPSAAAEK